MKRNQNKPQTWSAATCIRLTLLCVLGVATAGPGLAQENITGSTSTRAAAASGPKAQIEDLSWMVGHWTGQAMGGTMEAIMSPPGPGRS
jgi:hypothetical protein